MSETFRDPLNHAPDASSTALLLSDVFKVISPSDCIASESMVNNRHALALMQRVLKAKVIASRGVWF